MGAIEFGQLIKQARLRKGWQQQELGDRLGVDRGYISAIEGGKRNWPRQYIPALAAELGLNEIDMAITAGLISPPDDHQAADDVNDPLLNVVMHDARNLTPEGLEALRDIVRGLLKMQGSGGSEG